MKIVLTAVSASRTVSPFLLALFALQAALASAEFNLHDTVSSTPEDEPTKMSSAPAAMAGCGEGKLLIQAATSRPGVGAQP
jgi:hypothetical protein